LNFRSAGAACLQISPGDVQKISGRGGHVLPLIACIYSFHLNLISIPCFVYGIGIPRSFQPRFYQGHKSFCGALLA
jgi:hypothetical protein